MILRVFRVRGEKGNDEAVVQFVRERLARPNGPRPSPTSVQVGRRLAGGTVEVVVVSTWRAWGDIQAWTGPDVNLQLDPDLPPMFDVRVEHYESIELDGDGVSVDLSRGV